MTDNNPLLLHPQLPRFDLISPDLAEPAITSILEQAEAGLGLIEQTATFSWDGSMGRLLALTEPLEYAWGIISHLHGVMNTPSWRTAHETLLPRVVAFSTRLGQSEPVYKAIRGIRDDAATWGTLGETRQRLVETALKAAEHAGVGLPPEPRMRMRALQEALAAASTTFSNHLLDATRAYTLTLDNEADIVGIPLSLLQAASAAAITRGHPSSTPESGPWVISLEAPFFVPFMQYSERRDLRETLYRAYVTRASAGDSDNTQLIRDILNLRREMAALLDARSYADLALQTRMARDVESVVQLLERLHRVARPAAEREHAELEAFARQQGFGEPLMHWDVAFWAERMRKARFDFNDEDLRPYFQFPVVLEALFEVTQRLFGVRIAPADGETPVWHPDVRFFKVLDAAGGEIAHFYLDPYSRPESKRGGAWMDAARSRRNRHDGTPVPPAAYLVCNQSRPVGNRPALMTLSETTTLFHEFGHALQHLLTTVDIPAASGIHNVEWDAIELSSQFMENWCLHPPVLQRMSSHIETGEPLPPAMIGRIRQARTFRSGSAMLRQLFFAALDMELHHVHADGADDDPEQVKHRVARDYSILPMLAEDRFLCGFTHVFAGGYAAGYYSYKWAEVLSADAFAAFEEAGLDNPEALQATGRRFRDTVLALGGSRHPMAVFKAFRGREPDPAALLRQEGLLPDGPDTGR